MRTQRGADGRTRCSWCGEHADYVAYHDEEWGVPCGDDRRLFEKVCIEGFQAGLSWLTILRKREAFRRAFRDFDFEVVARFNARSVERLLGDAGIVRHRGKIEAAISNARCALELREEFGSLGAYFWTHEDRGPYAGELATTPASQALSRDLRRRGFRFVGPTTMYALMQAMGLVNDHVSGCEWRGSVERRRRAFRIPVRVPG